jgi:propionyl-CoA synthetase
MLRAHGVTKGDRVLIYMPMVPEAVVAMLACARVGAIHSVVFGGFAATELAKRVDDAQPKLVLTASCGMEATRILPYPPLLRAALQLTQHRPQAQIVLQRPQHLAVLEMERGERDWATELAAAATTHPAVACVPMAATDPLYILYTSGTTGRPKGVVRDHGGHAVALLRSMALVYDARPGDVFWAASDIGWVVGHSYIVYGPLLRGCTTVLYEGKPVGTPDAAAFWRVCERHRVRVLFTAPTALRAIKREDPDGRLAAQHPMPTLAALYLAGERSDPDSLAWAARTLGRPVLDHWWMTETGWGITALARGLEHQPVRVGSAGQVLPGYDVALLDEHGREVPSPLHPDHNAAAAAARAAKAKASGPTAAEASHLHDYEGTHVGAVAAGNIVLRLPLPPGTLPTLWRNDDGLRRAYLDRFPGYFDTGDAGYVDADGFLSVMSRADDIIQIAGHRLSTGMLEEVLAELPAVAECAVVGARDALKGMRPVGFLVLKAGAAASAAEVATAAVARVRTRIGAFACLDRCFVVDRVPKTRSGKVLRRNLRAIVNGDSVEPPATIEDPTVLDDVAAVVRAHPGGHNRVGT